MTHPLIAAVRSAGRTAMSESEAKNFLKGFGIPLPGERAVKSLAEAREAALALGLPVVLKGGGHRLLHKSEAGLVHLDLRTLDEVERAYRHITEKGGDLVEEVLVEQFVKARREVVAGLVRDPQFGPAVMFGLGGIFTEALKDVAFRIAPLSRLDARELMDEVKAAALLKPVRGTQAADLEALGRILITLGDLAMAHPDIREMDLNPVCIQDDGTPCVLDALITLAPPKEA